MTEMESGLLGWSKVYVDVLRGELGRRAPGTWAKGATGVGWWPLRAAAHSMLGTNPQFATGRRHGRATVAPIWGLLGGSNLGILSKRGSLCLQLAAF